MNSFSAKLLIVLCKHKFSKGSFFGTGGGGRGTVSSTEFLSILGHSESNINRTAGKNTQLILLEHGSTLSECLLILGAVTLDLFPKAPLGKITWVGFSLGFDRFHACGYTLINCPRGTVNLYPI